MFSPCSASFDKGCNLFDAALAAFARLKTECGKVVAMSRSLVSRVRTSMRLFYAGRERPLMRMLLSWGYIFRIFRTFCFIVP